MSEDGSFKDGNQSLRHPRRLPFLAARGFDSPAWAGGQLVVASCVSNFHRSPGTSG